jgi:hypothetical protein
MAQHEATLLSRAWWAGCGVSVGGSCPQIAEEAQARDGDDRHDEEFHDGSFLGPGGCSSSTSTSPVLLPTPYT